MRRHKQYRAACPRCGDYLLTTHPPESAEVAEWMIRHFDRYPKCAPPKEAK